MLGRSRLWDASENQLIVVWVTNVWQSQFVYDGKMRRRIRKEYTWSGSAWVKTNEVRYIYDGNLVIQERNINNLPATTYSRGPDLSGSLQGAGGIGGLLARTDNSQLIAHLSTAHAFYQSDVNGNVTFLIYTNQLIAAHYEYDPFGRILSQSGSLADANLYRFSSKELHLNSGLVYYLYRFYDPSIQRWSNRDPSQEGGGFNLYWLALNDSVNRIDALGLMTFDQIKATAAQIDAEVSQNECCCTGSPSLNLTLDITWAPSAFEQRRPLAARGSPIRARVNRQKSLRASVSPHY